MTALGLVGAGRPTIWYDEAVTLSLLQRPFGELWGVLREIDAVHAVYYVVLRGWTAVMGDSIGSVRAFSALGVGVTAALVVLLVARHQRLRTAVASGLFTGVAPGLAWAALDGRSYAWSAAFAVLATLALDSACRHRRRRDWLLYGLVCVLACWWHLYLVILVAAHGIAVMVGFPKGRLSWTLTAAVTAVGALPLAVIGWRQRDQVSWLADTNYTWHRMLLNQLASGPASDLRMLRMLVVGALLALGAYGVVHLWRKGRRWLPAVLALWSGLPTVVAMISTFVGGGMHPRYVAFAVPAFAIAAAIGVLALPKWTPAVAGVAMLVAISPLVVEQRAPSAKPDDLRRIAATAGDEDAAAVYFTVSKARSIQSAYPEHFDGLVDVSAPVDATPEPFFAGVRDPETIKGVDVDGLRVLVYGTRAARGAERLRQLGCRSEPVTGDRHFAVTLYTCPSLTDP
ncbi:glycosyltransferase family 39 protein [Nocardioides sp. HM23]|uniref:glycosyltransferase family 39 protein n=1 Tax=Nocardioides bizhenqiangii TaxID=3095076 RepID=UPI002ACA690B|nr:glycosyltransferase family 39 protein [Nocardioides sp. HM23]MDZ5620795.1 glycosyltransferase family 39 protein [Nocardioides sp. HM23]